MPMKTGPDLMAGPFGRKGGGLGPKTMSLKTEGKPPPPKPPGGVRIEDRVGIQAPAELIWEIVYDIGRWHEWNPTYTKAAGQVRIGDTLAMTLELPGQPAQEIRPKVLDWVPNEQLHWQLSFMGGLIRTLRYIEISPLSDTGCIVDNGEIFGGLMGPSLGRRVGRSVRAGFQAMNEALKARAEAEWTTRQG
ncbi:SRPBCC domain-containing protein [Phenylobacterium sp.]|uniref:SRPBCC domain-containing protein n=1 Tax=Phenylobacterium sp. TaxID=1871053 RepID=UPI0025E7162C|nr:SRPBCC domain-containing protein [Phenylobacterium sp.]